MTEDWHIDIESGTLEGSRLKKVLTIRRCTAGRVKKTWRGGCP
jgi:hypothetical protein